MPEATAATATFLFTDIEGSTELLKSLRGKYVAVFAEHQRLLRKTFEAYGGVEVDNQGDSFFVAFTRAKDAVLAAAECQRALAEQTWPDSAAVRVRMGIHTGEAELAAERYIGLSVHRAARISALAHGGQVLVSPTTASLLEDEADLPGVAIKDIGEHRLKDIARPVRLHQLEIDGLQTKFPPLKSVGAPPRNRWRRLAAAAAVVLVAAITIGWIALARGDDPPPPIVGNSLVRLDPKTLKPTDVVPVGAAPDLVVAAGGYLWLTHRILRGPEPGGIRNAGDRTVTRVDPASGDVMTVGGGLAPCGLTADPSGDVWVANCFTSGAELATVVRVDAKTLRFKATFPVPSGTGFYRGLIYGGGSLWVSETNREIVAGEPHALTQIDPDTRSRRSITITNPGFPLAWSGSYGDLWVSNFPSGTLTKIHASTHAVRTIEVDAQEPGSSAVEGDSVWVGDWAGPHLERVHAVGDPRPRTVTLPVVNRRDAPGVWSVAAGDGYVWAATPADKALWRIDPIANRVTRIAMPYPPAGVATGMGAVWITVRDHY